MRRWTTAALLGATSLLAPALGANDSPEASKAPMAKKIVKTTDIHGEKLADDYFWLRDRQNPEVKAYLEAENAFADAFMKPTEALQEKLYDEMLGRIKETDLSVPYRDGGYFYYSRTEKGKQYPIYCRKKGSLEAAGARSARLERDGEGRALHVGRRPRGLRRREPARLHDRQHGLPRVHAPRQGPLDRARTFPETVAKVSSVAWAADNKTLFYTVDDAAKRPYRLYRHALGADPDDDTLVYEEKDEMFTRGRRPLAEPQGPLPRLRLSHGRGVAFPARRQAARAVHDDLRRARKDHEYAVDHRGDLFYIRTNKGCRNFRVVTAPVAIPGNPIGRSSSPAARP